jgi:cytochrome d ubiquinol oxidase subunit I
MHDLLAARAQMGMSLAFHIVFASVEVAMPLFMAIAEWRYLKTGDEVYYTLARRWAVGTAIMFAVGAVSGTALSFELGLLWPRFMKWAGPIIGMPFSLEGLPSSLRRSSSEFTCTDGIAFRRGLISRRASLSRSVEWLRPSSL